jgi:hypothetical protein
MNSPKDEDPTPVPPYRRPTGSVTAWGILEAWLATHPDRRIFHRVVAGGHEVCAQHENGNVVCELVRPNEDPSQGAVRAIGKIR